MVTGNSPGTLPVRLGPLSGGDELRNLCSVATASPSPAAAEAAQDYPREGHGLERSLLPPSRRTRLPLVERPDTDLFIDAWSSSFGSLTEAIPHFWPTLHGGDARAHAWDGAGAGSRHRASREDAAQPHPRPREGRERGRASVLRGTTSSDWEKRTEVPVGSLYEWLGQKRDKRLN